MVRSFTLVLMAALTLLSAPEGLWRGDEMRRQPGRILLPGRLQDLRHLGRLSVRTCGRAVSGVSRQEGEAAMEPSVFSRCVASLAVIASLVLHLSGASMAAEPRAAALPSAPATERNLSRRIGFEANCGQVDAQVQFVARGPAYTAFLTSTEAVLTLGDRHGGHAVLRMERIGANAAARAAGSGLLPGVVSYFPDGRVDSPVNAPAYRRLRYDDVYPGIDLVYYSRARSLEYDFVVAPGVDPNQIALRIDGAERVEMDGEGTLVVHTAAGDVRQPRPV